jgi:DNA-binding CsgD family transcriptional regulator
VEQGRWGQAREACARTAAVGSAAGLDHAVACAAVVDATVLAYQGDTAAVRARIEDVLALIDPVESRSVSVYSLRALGAAAIADGASPRLRALVSRARDLLADPEDAEPHFRAALADPGLEHWPFERAQTLLDLAEWLRRRRRVTEARGPLAEALRTFRRLGARPWIERAGSEARAAGLDITDPAPDALARLSPQQQQIIRLAARGLTNREIGERLLLSPRTVGSHLYRSFPKLGVAARSQLRDLVEDVPPTTGHRG